MKKILIVSDGAIGRHFIERVIATHTTDNIYYVVQSRATPFEGYNQARFKFFEFDSTSYYKLTNVLKMDFTQVILALENQTDLDQTIRNIRMYKANMRIIALDLWNSQSANDDVEWVNMQEILASNLIDYLPNLPVLAKNVGLGSGEIMEVLVPFGSSFVYRYISSIEQKNWKIAAIYRNGSLVLPDEHKMLHPNDSLVLVGDPAVLRSVYRAIKRELGQFPAPFGSKIYLYIDMQSDHKDQIMALVRRSIFIQKKLKQPLVIKVLNPNDIDLLRMIKASAQGDITVDISIDPKIDQNIILEDIKKYHIGLFIVSEKIFSQKSMRKKLYTGNVPVLKLADRSFSGIKESVVILNAESHVENISTTVFDVSSQFGYNLELISFQGEHEEHTNEIIRHFSDLSTIFSKSIKLNSSEDNPIRTLQKKENFLQCLPFTDKMFRSATERLFSVDPEVHYGRLKGYHQLFIPTQI